ncbi:hypothetical protein QM588_25435 [Rhodococcus sp. IEGM 1354]|uniref:sugar ABC transporter permease n=1 Tax=Rhodococcus sp. IEGM 1354 TaxID=3047088 RepID=UPI0024B7155C|nr:hypothetical protein [Rhodococcus sp. IEGM 1354]MDI9933771.1 hypothetical protein [Rhodococcus sp. IEGM 1354]
MTTTTNDPAPSAPQAPPKGGDAPGHRGFNRFGVPVSQLRALTLIGVLILMWLVFQVLTDGLFLTPRNLTTLTVQVAITALLAAGVVMIMVCGHIDLSVGSSVGFCAVFSALLVDSTNGFGLSLSTPVLILMTIGVGMVIGVWQGFWVAVLGVPSFIVTLGSLLGLRGLALALTDGSTVSAGSSVSFISQTYLSTWVFVPLIVLLLAAFIWAKYREFRARQDAGIEASITSIVVIPAALTFVAALAATLVMASYRGAPLPSAIMVVVLVVVTFMLARTRFGRSLYAIGGNAEAARYAGINARKLTFIVFVFMGVLYGIAGLMMLSRSGVGSPNAGVGLELSVIGAAVIGGTSLFGGVGTATGAVFGALLLETLINGMGLMNIDSSYQMIVTGVVLLVAVYIDIRGRRAHA